MNKLITSIALLSSLAFSQAAFSATRPARADAELTKKLGVSHDAVLHTNEERLAGTDKTWVSGEVLGDGRTLKTFRASFDTHTGGNVEIFSQSQAHGLDREGTLKVDSALKAQLGLGADAVLHTDSQEISGTERSIVTGKAFLGGRQVKTFTATYDARSGNGLTVDSQSHSEPMTKEIWGRVDSALNAQLGLGPEAVVHTDAQEITGTGRTILKGTAFVGGRQMKTFRATYETKSGDKLEMISQSE